MLLGYIPGVWDLFHVGHLTILERASQLCNTLVVGVPSDDVVKEDKGKFPVVTLKQRIRILEALECVSFALTYYNLEFITHLQMLKPDIFVVGSTWGKDDRHLEAEAWVTNNKKRMVILPYSHEVSTTHLIQRCKGL